MNDKSTVIMTINLDDPSTYILPMQDKTLLARFANEIWDEMDQKGIPYGDRDPNNAGRFALAALEPLQTVAGYVESAWRKYQKADFRVALEMIEKDYLSANEEDMLGDRVTVILAARGFDWPDDTFTDENLTQGQQVYRAIVRPAAMALRSIANELAQAERV